MNNSNIYAGIAIATAAATAAAVVLLKKKINDRIDDTIDQSNEVNQDIVDMIDSNSSKIEELQAQLSALKDSIACNNGAEKVGHIDVDGFDDPKEEPIDLGELAATIDDVK